MLQRFVCQQIRKNKFPQASQQDWWKNQTCLKGKINAEMPVKTKINQKIF
jgi:hypothetical protein